MKEFSACANKIIKIISCFSGLFLTFALQASELNQGNNLPASDPMASIGKVVFVLIAMIALILLLAYWAKKLQGMNSSSLSGFASQGKLIKTLATVSIGLKEKISLIQVGEQQILIGITPHSIQTLLVLETNIELEDIEQQTPVFQNLLKKALHKS